MANENEQDQTPLQRYLAKQKSAPEASAGEDRGIEGGAPAYPPPGSTTPPPPEGPPPGVSGFGSYEFSQSAGIVPGGVGIRFVAYLIDFVLVALINAGVHMMLTVAVFFFPDFLRSAFSAVAYFGVIFFYYGWFYSERGASPGKQIMNLQIIETGTGRRIGYWRSFFRETLGKAISGILFIGYIIALFREDKRALHDLIFDTRVIQRKGI